MSDPEPPRVTVTPADALKAARAILRRAVDGEAVTLTPPASEAINAAMWDLHSEVGLLKRRLDAAARREVADREIQLGEEARATRAENALAQAITHLAACAYAKDTPALSGALVAARAWLAAQGAT